MTRALEQQFEAALAETRMPRARVGTFEVAGRLAAALGHNDQARDVFIEASQRAVSAEREFATKYIRAGNMTTLAGDPTGGAEALAHALGLPDISVLDRIGALIMLGRYEDATSAAAEFPRSDFPQPLQLGLAVIEARLSGDSEAEQRAMEILQSAADGSSVESSNVHPTERDLVMYLGGGADQVAASSIGSLGTIDIPGAEVVGWWGNYVVLDAGAEMLLVDAGTTSISYQVPVADQSAPWWHAGGAVFSTTTHGYSLLNSPDGLQAVRFAARFSQFGFGGSFAVQAAQPNVVSVTGDAIELPDPATSYFAPVVAHRSTHVAYLASGASVRIVELVGGQVVPVSAFNVADIDDSDELLSMSGLAWAADDQHLYASVEASALVVKIDLSGSIVNQRLVETGDIEAIVVSLAGGKVAVVGGSGSIELIDESADTQAVHYADLGVNDAHFDAAGAYLAARNDQGNWLFIDQQAMPVELAAATSAAFHPAEPLLATSDGTTLKLYRLPT